MGLNHGLPINHFYIFEHWAQPSIEDYFDCIWTYEPNLCCYNGRLHIVVQSAMITNQSSGHLLYWSFSSIPDFVKKVSSWLITSPQRPSALQAEPLFSQDDTQFGRVSSPCQFPELN